MKRNEGTWVSIYPNDLFVKEGSSIYKAPFAGGTTAQGGTPYGLAVLINQNTSNLSSEAYESKAGWETDPGTVVIKNKPQYFDSLDATIIYGMGGAGSPGPNVYIARNGKMITFETDGVGVEMLNKILSTLKFLK